MAHRDDIQGLRAVAVLLVALAHAGVPAFRGGYVGVDVFFVVSGFLITSILLAEAETRGSISLRRFYARRVRRIVPAAAVTLVVTDIVAHHLLNFVRAREVAWDSVWASAFAANVDFARHGTDYFAQAQPPSPLLHFWSLSVEEQFYVVWPTLLALVLCGPVLRRPRRRRALLAVVALAGFASLAWSIESTRGATGVAYFSTPARAWELALGAALAIVVPVLPASPRVRALGGWLGFAAIAGAAAGFSASTPFPGCAALLPTVGAALVIVAGDARRQRSLRVGRLLATAPFRYVGDRSYAFYLWHWPVLVIASQYAGRDLPVRVKLALLLGAFALSVVSYRFVEDPIRRRGFPKRAGIVLWPASATAALLVAVLVLRSVGATAARVDAAAAMLHVPRLVDTAAAATFAPAAQKPLPAVVAAVRAAEAGAPLPSPLVPAVNTLRNDFYFFPAGCTPGRGETESKICRLGATNGPKTIVVIGDSHAEMWMPAILQMGQQDGWAVIPLVKAACIPRTWPAGGECGTWYRWATKTAQALRPAVTMIIGSRSGTHDPRASIKPTLAAAKAMKRFSVSVIVVGDVPNQTRDPVDCLLAPGATMKTCTSEGTRAQARTEAVISARATAAGVGYIDARPWFCAHPRRSTTRLLCPMVVNHTITAIDRGHASKTYVLELKQSFRAAFRRALFG